VGLGEIGLDYHFDPPHSAPEVQRSILRRQLKLAVKLGKPLTIHTREAEEDTYQILKEEVPQDWKVMRFSVIYSVFDWIIDLTYIRSTYIALLIRQSLRGDC
jgi:Tat protein secretion system quality control protein TatD with DNase activity